MRASAAAHVAMMDELNKGIRTYRVLKGNELPSRFDSLLAANGTAAANFFTGASLGEITDYSEGDGTSAADIINADAIIKEIPTKIQDVMFDTGIQQLMYVKFDNDSPCQLESASGVVNSDYLKEYVGSRTNDVVAGNIFMPMDSNGCGFALTLADILDNGDVESAYIPGGQANMSAGDLATNIVYGLFWNGALSRIAGENVEPGYNNTAIKEGHPAYLLLGVGPASTLFNANDLGGLTSTPAYRHVKGDQYNRFISVWNIGTWDANGTGANVSLDKAQPELVTIVDGALDTKDEELGEWDGTRNTI